MTFLFPAMLVGLIGIAIPTVLHLIARHRFPVQDFPSIRLLTGEKRNNVIAPRLIDKPQLLLRILVLLLLILAMSRLFISVGSTPAPRSLVIVIDGSGSMNMRGPSNVAARRPGDASATQRPPTLFDLARSKAVELIDKVDPPSQCAIVFAGEDTRLIGDGLGVIATDDARAKLHTSLDKLQATDGAGPGLINAIATAGELLSGRREMRSQIVVLTDMRASAFAARGSADLERLARARADLGAALDVIFIDVSGPDAENVAIVDSQVRGPLVKVGDDAHILVRVKNEGAKEATAKVRLAVGDREEPGIREFALAPGAQAVVDLTTRMNRAIRTVATARLEDDALGLDDASFVPLNVADARRVLIVSGRAGGAAAAAAADAPVAALQGGAAAATVGAPAAADAVDGAVILRYVLNPGRELGLGFGTSIDTTSIAADALAGQTLSKYDVVVLHDVSSLPEPSLADLEAYVKQGRSLLIIASGGSSAVQFNRSIAAASGARAALSPAQLGNDRVPEIPVGIQQGALAHPLLAPFRDPLQGDLSIIRFTRVRDVQATADGATPLMMGTDGKPLALEQSLGRGRVVLFLFGLELERGNIARTRVFPALTWRLIDYLTGQLARRPADVLTALKPAVLDVSEPSFSFASELALVPAAANSGPATAPAAPQPVESAGIPVLLPISSDRSVLVPALPAGQYVLRKAPVAGETNTVIGYSRQITIRPDPIESQMAKLTEPAFHDLIGPAATQLPIASATSVEPMGREFWPWLVALLIVAYAAEAVIGWRSSRQRERERGRTLA